MIKEHYALEEKINRQMFLVVERWEDNKSEFTRYNNRMVSNNYKFFLQQENRDILYKLNARAEQLAAITKAGDELAAIFNTKLKILRKESNKLSDTMAKITEEDQLIVMEIKRTELEEKINLVKADKTTALEPFTKDRNVHTKAFNYWKQNLEQRLKNYFNPPMFWDQ